MGASRDGFGPLAGERDGTAGTGEGSPGAAPGGDGRDGVKLGAGAAPGLGKLGVRGKLAALGAGAAGVVCGDCWNRSWGSSRGN